MAGFKSRSRRLRYERRLRSQAREDYANTMAQMQRYIPSTKSIMREARKLGAKPDPDSVRILSHEYLKRQAKRNEQRARKSIRMNGKTSQLAKYKPNAVVNKPTLKYVPNYGPPRPAYKKPTHYQYTYNLSDEVITQAEYFELLKVKRAKSGEYKFTSKGYRKILGLKRIPHFD